VDIFKFLTKEKRRDFRNSDPKEKRFAFHH
jgi:hypothetical protein